MKKYKVSAYPWFAEMYNIYSGDWAVLGQPHAGVLESGRCIYNHLKGPRVARARDSYTPGENYRLQPPNTLKRTNIHLIKSAEDNKATRTI